MKAGVVKEHYATLLTREESLLQNIKSKETQKAVRAALKKMRQFLHTLRTVPSPGLALFAGENDLTVLQPDIPLKISFYQCGKTFAVDVLAAYCTPPVATLAAPVFGWLHITGEDVVAGTWQGKAETVHRFRRPGGTLHRHNKGGQSAPRFQRLFDAADEGWLTEVCAWVHRTAWTQPLVHVFLGGIAENRTGMAHRLPSTWVRHTTHPLPTFSLYPSAGCAKEFSAHVAAVHIPEYSVLQHQAVAQQCFHLLQTVPDKVVVGWPMVQRAAAMRLIEKVYLEPHWHAQWEGPLPTHTVLVPPHTLTQLGGICAVLMYTYDGWDENE